MTDKEQKIVRVSAIWNEKSEAARVNVERTKQKKRLKNSG